MRYSFPVVSSLGLQRPVFRLGYVLVLAAALAGCGGSGTKAPSDGLPRLDFSYDTSAPLRYADHGRINKASYPIAIHNVTFSSGGRTIEAYLLVPPGSGKRPAVVFVHGSGGDRSELLGQAADLAARNVVTLTITAPSHAVTKTPRTLNGLLDQARALTVNDVVAVRRAVDVLQTLPSVDDKRIGYVGWSAGARLGAVVAASEPRIKAFVLVSAGADPLSAFVANAPAGARDKVRRVLGSVDPLRYIAWAQPGSLLLEDGRRDEVVPQSALMNVVDAAPKGTKVRWYAAGHALNRKAYRDAFDWLATKLPIDGPRVKGT
jgi:dienelactone hydrolase